MGLFNRSKIRKEQEKEHYFLMLMNNYETNKQKIPNKAKTFQIKDNLNNTFTIFINDNKLCFVKHPDHEMAHIEEWMRKDDSFNFKKHPLESLFYVYAHHTPLNPIGDYREIKLSDIHSFEEFNRRTVTSSTTGGGGGGFSLAGAVGGYIVGGSVGAVLNSIKKPEPQTTRIIDIHSVGVQLEYYDDILGQDWLTSFTTDSYDVFKKLIPEKEHDLAEQHEFEDAYNNFPIYTTIPELQDRIKARETNQAPTPKDSLKDRLKQLQELLNEGLISEEEFLEKRNEILKSI